MNTPLTVVAATANPGKLVEMAAILGGSVELLPRPTTVPDIIEDAPDLVGNARLKATIIATATGYAALADDTGLEVTALGGAPGVYSARYAGEQATSDDNITLLLERLAGASDRSAAFHTVCVLRSESFELIAHGRCEGVILDHRRGEGGFGYDSVFIPAEGDGRTFAEMTLDEKNSISHRGRSLRALADELLRTQ